MSLPTALLAAALQRFQLAARQPEAAQQQILQQILQQNAASRFGRQHGFASIAGYSAFARQVPVRRYEDYRTDIEALAAGGSGLLTAEPVIQFEETGGSSGGAKLIPYTDSLLAAFRRGVLPWLADFVQHRPQAFAGRLFFIISPAGRRSHHTAGGTPIGSGNDLAYFGAETGAALAAQTLFQPELTQARSAAEWQWHSARLLLSAADLSLISVWSPTLLLAIFRTLVAEQDSLLASLDAGRRHAAKGAFRGSGFDARLLWPQLDAVSCWDSHTAAAPAAELQALLPDVHIQGKGLLATEAVSSLPFSGSPHPLLAVDSHFYEFVDDDGSIRLAHQLRSGQDYRLIVTTQGGLYRYDTGDRVAVHGFSGALPRLEFIGRDHLASDLCGEKLTEAFVRRAMLAVDKRLPEQALLQGVAANPPHYRLLLPEHAPYPPQLAARLDDALAANPQYAYARRIGQLAPVEAVCLPDPHAYAATLHHADQRLATRKTPLLLTSYFPAAASGKQAT